MSVLRRLALPALLLSAFGLRILNLTGESLWRDEVDIIRFSLMPLDALLRNFPRNGFNGPLYLLLMRGWFGLAGVGDFSLRYFSLVFGVLLIALLYTLVRRLFGRQPAWIAACLCALAPVEIWYSGEGKMYTLQPALLILALYALLRLLSVARSPTAKPEAGPDWQPGSAPMPAVRPANGMASEAWASQAWALVLVLSASAAFYIHLLSPLVLGVLALWAVLSGHAARARLRLLLASLAALTLPYLPLLLWQLPTFLRGGGTGHTFYPLDTMLLALASDWSIGFGQGAPIFFLTQPEFLRWASVVFFLAVAAAGVVQSWVRTPRAVGMLLVWLFLPALAVFALSLRTPVFQPRYLLWSAPALYTLMALAAPPVGAPALVAAPMLARLSRWGMRFVWSVCGLIALLGLAAQIVTPIRPDVRGGAAYVAAHLQPGDALVFQIPYGRYGFDYYLRLAEFDRQPSVANFESSALSARHIELIEAPYTNGGMASGQVASELRGAIGPAQRIWLIETEAEMWDADGLVRQWMDTTLPLLQKEDFRGVRVSLHQTTLDKRLYLPNMQR